MVGSRLLGMGIGVVSLILYTRLLRPTDVALISVYAMLSSLVYMVSNLGLGLYVARQMPRLEVSDAASSRLLGHSYVLVVAVMSPLCCAALVIAARPLAALLLAEAGAETPDLAVLRRQLLLLMPAILMGSWTNVVAVIMRGRSMFGWISLHGVVMQVLHPLLIVSLFIWLDTTGLLLGLVLANVLPNLMVSWLVRDYLVGPVSWRRLGSFLRDAWPYYAEDYASYFSLYADQWMVGILMRPADLAIYYVAKTMFDRLFTLMDAVNNVALASIATVASHGAEVVRSSFIKVRRAYAYMFSPLSAIMLASSFWIVDLLVGSEYRSAWKPFAVLCIAFFLTAIYSPHAIGVMVLASPKKRLIGVIFQSVALIAALLPLGWYFGLVGVAASRIVGRAVAGLYSAAIVRSILQYGWDRTALRALPPATFGLLGWLVLMQVLFYDPLVVPIYLALGFVGYVLSFARRTSPEDLRVLADMLPPSARRLVPFLAKLQVG